MTTNSQINSGFRSIAISDVNGNVTGANVQELTVASVANLKIGSGVNGLVLATDGAGNLSWMTTTGIYATADYLANGTSNLRFSTGNTHITMSVGGNSNIVTVSSNTTTINGVADLGSISNVKLAGGDQYKYVQSSNNNGDLSWGPDQYVIPELGYGGGRMFAYGDKIWTAGAGTLSYMTAISDYSGAVVTSYSVTINGNFLASFTSPLEYFVKVYDSSTSIYALGNNGVLYFQGYPRQSGIYTQSTNDYAYALMPITVSAIYGPGITVENFWSTHDNPTTFGPSQSEGQCIVQVMDNGVRRCYAFGINTNQSLGSGVNTVPLPVTELVALRGKNLVSVSMTENNSMVVTDTGEVFAAGSNTDGQCGVGLVGVTNTQTFTGSTFLTGNALITTATATTISQFPTTDYVSFVLLANGTVFGCGSGTNNRLGNGATTVQGRFVQVLKAAATPLTNIVKIQSRCTDTMALDNSGNLWAWGVNYNGLWGNGDPLNTSSPYAKIIQTGVSDFWILSRANGTDRYMVFTKTDGTTWGCGSNASYQIGVDSVSTATIFTAIRIYFSQKGEYCVRAKPVGGVNGTMFLTNKNRVYVCGLATYEAAAYGNCGVLPLPVPINDVKYY